MPGQRRGERAVGQQDLVFCFLRILSPHLGLFKHCPVLYPPLNSSPLPLPQFRGPVRHTETASQKYLRLFLFINLSYLLTNEEKKIEQIKLFTTIHTCLYPLFQGPHIADTGARKAFQTGQSSLS